MAIFNGYVKLPEGIVFYDRYLQFRLEYFMGTFWIENQIPPKWWPPVKFWRSLGHSPLTPLLCWFTGGSSHWDNYPLVSIQKAIEHGHRKSWFTHWKWWFSIDSHDKDSLATWNQRTLSDPNWLTLNSTLNLDLPLNLRPSTTWKMGSERLHSKGHVQGLNF